VDELIGTVLGGGRYRIDKRLGSGGQGTVYKGTHLTLNIPVAIKVLPALASHDRASRVRFEREARRAATLQHANIVRVYDYAFERGMYYIVSEFIEGADLKKLIRASGGPMPIEQTLGYARQVADALDFAHEQDIIHRDIKPANILIETQHDRIALCDFGLARMVEGEEVDVTSDRGTTPGTPAYMSPEQCLGGDLDQRTDVYSLGIVIYEMLTGINPFRGARDTSASVIYKQVNEYPVEPRSLNPRLNRQVDDVVLRALAKDREERFQTAGEFISALEGAVKGARVPGAGVRIPAWVPLVVAGAAIVLAMAFVPGPRDAVLGLLKRVAGARPGEVAGATETPPATFSYAGFLKAQQGTQTAVAASQPSPIATTLVPSPTPTSEPTPVPPTATPVPDTATPVPPTNTPRPPTSTPVPPTETPVLPTPTRRPPTQTPIPPTPTPVPLAVIYGVQVDNAEFGKGTISFENRGMWISVPGAQYVGDIGFLSSPEASAEIQRVWSHRLYGGGNWSVKVVVRNKVGWVSCPASKATCSEDKIDGTQVIITHEVYMQPDVWASLLNDFLRGGLSATTQNPHYDDIQKMIFESYSSITPQVPCIGFAFKRAG